VQRVVAQALIGALRMVVCEAIGGDGPRSGFATGPALSHGGVAAGHQPISDPLSDEGQVAEFAAPSSAPTYCDRITGDVVNLQWIAAMLC
jgi:hypothetical protein